VGIIFAGLENRDYLFVDAMVPEGPAERSGQVFFCLQQMLLTVLMKFGRLLFC
jgi:hypothetical protein